MGCLLSCTSCLHMLLTCCLFLGIQGVILLLCDVANPVAVLLFFEQDSHGLLCELSYHAAVLALIPDYPHKVVVKRLYCIPVPSAI